MKVSFADNLTRAVLEVLAPKVSSAKELLFAVAFVSRSGLSLIQNELLECLASGGRAEFLVGLDFLNTEAEALRTLLKMKEQGLLVSCYCFWGQGPAASVYHPKLYIIKGITEMTAMVGSSNLTQGGLQSNLEVNAVFEADPTEELVSDLYGAYNRLKFQQNRFEPDLELVSIYQELHQQSRKRAQETEVAIEPSLRRFRDKVNTLPRPAATAANLFGWQKLVYDSLPAGVFRTSYLYRFEKDFADRYPENQHIRDKIRQILQQLRDLGLVRHLAQDQWERKR